MIDIYIHNIHYATNIHGLLIRTIENLDKKNESQRDYYYHRIVRDIVKNICAGNDERASIELVANEYCPKELRYSDLVLIWNCAKRERNALTLYGRAFTAKKMKLAGFSVSEIACTLSISQTSVRNLLKSSCNIA